MWRSCVVRPPFSLYVYDFMCSQCYSTSTLHASWFPSTFQTLVIVFQLSLRVAVCTALFRSWTSRALSRFYLKCFKTFSLAFLAADTACTYEASASFEDVSDEETVAWWELSVSRKLRDLFLGSGSRQQGGPTINTAVAVVLVSLERRQKVTYIPL